MVKVILFIFCFCRWSGSYQTHVSLQDVPELRKFIQACLTNEITDALTRALLTSDNTRVVLHLEHKALHLILFHKFLLPFLCIHIHGAEFVKLKNTSILTHTILGKENRSRGSFLDGRCHKNKCDSA